MEHKRMPTLYDLSMALFVSSSQLEQWASAWSSVNLAHYSFFLVLRLSSV